MTIKAIPTEYKGREFRSRLEARWARFFDLLGWQHEYEPCDLDGWIPDFFIYGESVIPVEVKPCLPYGELDKFPTEKILKATLGTGHDEVLLLGNTVGSRWNRATGEPAIGTLLCIYNDGKKRFPVADIAALNRGNSGAYPEWGFFSEWGYWGDRVTGKYDGPRHIVRPDEMEVRILWNRAANRVQWHRPKQIWS